MDPNEGALETLKQIQFDPKGGCQPLGPFQGLEAFLLPAQDLVPLEILRQRVGKNCREDFVNRFGKRDRSPIFEPERIALTFVEEYSGEFNKGGVNITDAKAELKVFLELS